MKNAVDNAPSHLLGSSFERAGFSEVRRLGAGSFGSVYFARGPDGAQVALKRLLGNIAPYRVVAEMKLLEQASVGSGGLIPDLVSGFRDTDGMVMAMTYFSHDDFRGYLGTLSWPQLQTYSHQLFSALAHVHSRGVIHRDVKPRNFLFNVRSGQGCLVDFGLAQSASLWESRREALESLRESKRQRKSSSSSSTLPFSSSSVLSTELSSAGKGQPSSAAAAAAAPSSSSSRPQCGASPAAGAAGAAGQGPPGATTRGGSTRAMGGAASVSGGGMQSRRLVAALGGGAAANPAPPNPPSPPEAASTTGNSRGKKRHLATSGPVAAAAAAVACSVQQHEALPKRPDRAGTPGFRAPEVLLHSMDQSPALDVWAAGVCVLCLLSRRYPFFSCQDRSDEPWLLQVASLLGPSKVVAAASELGKTVNLPSAQELSFDSAVSIGTLFAPAFHPPSPLPPPLLPASPPSPGKNSFSPKARAGGAAGARGKGKQAAPVASSPAAKAADSPADDVWQQEMHRAAEDFVLQTLEPSPSLRVSAASALEMPFIVAARART